MNRILHIVMFACAIVVAFCSCEADEQLPTANGGENIYTISLDAALNDYEAATTRVGYDWSDGTILYLQFVVGNQTIVGNATYSKEADAWSVTTTEALANVDSARCEAYYFKELVQSETSVIPLSNTTAVYQDTCGYYVKTDNYLSVSLRLSPKTGRIRFKGEPGRKFTIRGMYQLSGYDILENRFDSTQVELLPTVLADGYTPYYYTAFTDTFRTLTVVDGLIEYTKDCSSTILADGKSGYMALPTEEKHTGWTALSKDTVAAEAIDLGLSVKWASCNVGATAPEEYGGYYAWGEIEEKENYDWSTYKWCNGDIYSITKYCTDINYGTVDNKTVLDSEDDVAHVKWGGAWRMPTLDEIKELSDKCSWNWTSQNGLKGCKVIGPNGNSIFLPAAGCRFSGGDEYRGSFCLYLSDDLASVFCNEAEILLSTNDECRLATHARCVGHTVRPVQNKNTVEEEPIVETIAGVLASGEGKTLKTQGTIVTTHTHGILVHDETGYIHIRLDANTDNVVGDVVTVKGNLTPWGGLLEFAAGAIVEKVGTAEVVHPEPIVWDGVALDSYLSTPKIQYVQYTGVLSQNESIYNVAVDGASTAIGSIDCPSTDMVNADWIGKKVTVTGYAYGCNDEQSVSTMAISVEVVEEPVEGEPTIDETAVAEAVDLGLSVKWASWNVGATAPEESGGYYAWGETKPKDYYPADYDPPTSWNNISSTQYDVAHVKWGNGWRMPTGGEMHELCNNCSWQRDSINGINGILITGVTGNSIFLPASGYYYDKELRKEGARGYYWAGEETFNIGQNSDLPNCLRLDLEEDVFQCITTWHHFGFPIRPVKE